MQTYIHMRIWCMYIDIYGLIATASASASGWPWPMPCAPPSLAAIFTPAISTFMIACLCVSVCELLFRIIVKWQRNKGRRNWVKSQAAFLLYFDLRAMQHCLFSLPFPVSLLSVSQASRLSPRATDRYRQRYRQRNKGTDRETHAGSLLFSSPYLLTHSQYTICICTHSHTDKQTDTHTQMCVYTVPLCLCVCAWQIVKLRSRRRRGDQVIADADAAEKLDWQ